MEKEEYMSLAVERYGELEQLKSADNFYNYEKGFDKIWQDLGRRYMESYLNETSKMDRRLLFRFDSHIGLLSCQ